MKRPWNKKEVEKLKALHASGRYTNPEIGRMLGRSAGVIQLKLKYLGLSNGTYRRRTTKHAHLREAVLRFFVDHTWEQTRAHFGFTASELKSCFTYAYKNPQLRRIRKDKRRKDAWSLEETLFLMRHAGIQPRIWIAKRLDRGGVHSVKEALSRLGHGSKHVNGMPLKWAQLIFGESSIFSEIKTKAGPTGGQRGNFNFRIIPWVQCERLANKRPDVPDEIKGLIRAMAKFQRWIHGGVSDEWIVRQIKQAAREG